MFLGRMFRDNKNSFDIKTCQIEWHSAGFDTTWDLDECCQTIQLKNQHG